MYQKAFTFSKNIPFLGINDDDDDDEDDYIVEYLTGHRISHAHITPGPRALSQVVTASLQGDHRWVRSMVLERA